MANKWSFNLQFKIWLHRHGASSVALPLLAVLCVSAHTIACRALDSVDPSTIPATSKMAMRVAIVHYIDTHLWMVFGYFVFALACLLRLELRHAPRWSIWSVWIFLALPALAYAYGCLRVTIRLF